MGNALSESHATAASWVATMIVVKREHMAAVRPRICFWFPRQVCPWVEGVRFLAWDQVDSPME